MNEASPLKVREYLAVGLPVLCGYSDPDVLQLGDLCLTIANTETNVVDELPRIDEYIRRSRGVRVPRSMVQHIDASYKEQQRLTVFSNALEART
jgi:hypothetical protein